MKYAPIATKHNNRYRGPVESFKDVAFESDINYNLSFLKEKYAHFESELKHINDKIKSNKDIYLELRADLNIVKHKIENSFNVLNNV